jgi:hypothetical protein
VVRSQVSSLSGLGSWGRQRCGVCVCAALLLLRVPTAPSSTRVPRACFCVPTSHSDTPAFHTTPDPLRTTPDPLHTTPDPLHTTPDPLHTRTPYPAPYPTPSVFPTQLSC